MSNALVQSLAGICREHVLDEKWLIAPSRRIAHQWLDQAVLAGAPVVNIHVHTTRSLALDVMKPELSAGGLTVLSPAVGRLVIAAAWERAMASGGYLGRARTTPRLLALAGQTVRDLRMAGLSPGDLSAARFEQPAKGDELRAMLAAYEDALAERRLIDHADVMRRAIERLRAQGDGDGVVLIVPHDAHRTVLEQRLLDAFGGRCLPLAADPPAAGVPPAAAASCRVVHAVGEANEVRLALRACLARDLPLDTVELLYTADDPYVALIYDTALRVLDFDPGLDLGVPVTFADGVPARMGRPGRLLAAWLSWIRDGFPQSGLLRMLEAGLLEPGTGDGGARVGAARLARAFRRLGIGFGRDRHLKVADEHVAALAARGAPTGGEEPDPDPEAPARLARSLETARALAALLHRIIEASPSPGAGPQAIVAAAVALVRDHARAAGALDGLARHHLLGELEAMEVALSLGAPAGFGAGDWLAELPDRLRVGGSAPRPGHLHVAPLASGGHSGRAETFVLGLNDNRFPSAGYQDPLMLDAERSGLGALPTSRDRLGRQIDDFNRLLGRVRGRVTLSFSSRNVADDSETFASPVVLAAYRVLAERPDGDHGDLGRWLPPAASFAPQDPAECLDAGEWWLWAAAREPPADNLAALARGAYAHLERGQRATDARRSSAFTVFDGLVERPGPELDLAGPRGPVVSATGWLQMLGACPLRYFYRRVLGIRPPDEVEVDRGQWLTALEYGTLLHEVLYEFGSGLIERDTWPPVPERDLPVIRRIAEAHAARWRERVVPPGPAAEARRRESLGRACEIFVNEQARRGRFRRPVYLEASIGMPTEKRPTDLDAPDAVAVALPGGGAIRARARIDRIDRKLDGNAPDEPVFSILDYKSGSYAKPYDPPDVYDGGRLVQHVLYMAVAQAALRERSGPEARVDEFRFVFPGTRTHGREIPFGYHVVEGGLEVIKHLAALAAGGAFPATDKVDDCRYCEFQGACRAIDRDLEPLCARTRSKMADGDNAALRPFVEVRRGG